MSSTCIPILVGVVSPVSEIKLAYGPKKVENFNRSESAQIVYASRGRCHVHAHQLWWA